jgi:hypothetical protein
LLGLLDKEKKKNQDFAFFYNAMFYMFRNFCSSFLYFPAIDQIFSSVYPLVNTGKTRKLHIALTAFGIIFRTIVRAIGGYQKAGTSSLKRVEVGFFYN